ncbi:MAG: class I SAM-dependent methyltransferase [Saprospiraceae bacterium]|nr:class I SAM-dependent methyltransferase [Saprospiraceae bacterium]
MEIIQTFKRYFHFYRNAKTIYDIHSPLAADIIKWYYSKNPDLSPFLSEYRRELLQNRSAVSTLDLGAGSKSKNKNPTVSDIATRSLSSPTQMIGMHRICMEQKPEYILELGTSFGLMSLSLQAAAPEAILYTIEGNPTVAEIARSLIERSPLKNKPILIVGSFDQKLPTLLELVPRLNFVFIDGDHTYEGTMKYLTMIIPKLDPHAMVLIHDIHWSSEMEKAWQECRNLSSVQMSLEFFELGILLFRREILQKQHFSILPYWQKPWRVGLFA